jgi:hypothetical protein
VTRILMKYKLAYVDEVGLVVHVHENKIFKEKFEEITADYMKKFSHLINQMPEKDRIKIEKMINLQLFRYFITTSGKRKKGVNQMLNGKLSMYLICRYAIHLLTRKITKQAYGFKI